MRDLHNSDIEQLMPSIRKKQKEKKGANAGGKLTKKGKSKRKKDNPNDIDFEKLIGKDID